MLGNIELKSKLEYSIESDFKFHGQIIVMNQNLRNYFALCLLYVLCLYKERLRKEKYMINNKKRYKFCLDLKKLRLHERD